MTRLTITPEQIPQPYSGMDTAPGITDAELKAMLARAMGVANVYDLPLPVSAILTFGRAIERAVASRTRQATPAPDALLQDVLLAIKRREAYPGELSYLERQLNEILIRTPVPARSPGT